ncbi:hypothetical protein WG907_12745 [Sphingobium sp. AN558]|uniref:hypothetical protein n=1 Tax=Sphingobium sp. AN558 TaxID=3133442 RepID=UPI0030C14FCC
MSQFKHHDSATAGSVRAAVMMIAFGIAVLAFLVSIEHPEWFRLRPMTGAAVGMSHASDSVAGSEGDGHDTRNGNISE